MVHHVVEVRRLHRLLPQLLRLLLREASRSESQSATTRPGIRDLGPRPVVSVDVVRIGRPSEDRGPPAGVGGGGGGLGRAAPVGSEVVRGSAGADSGRLEREKTRHYRERQEKGGIFALIVWCGGRKRSRYKEKEQGTDKVAIEDGHVAADARISFQSFTLFSYGNIPAFSLCHVIPYPTGTIYFIFFIRILSNESL